MCVCERVRKREGVVLALPVCLLQCIVLCAVDDDFDDVCRFQSYDLGSRVDILVSITK